jgi:hypothetical protein
MQHEAHFTGQAGEFLVAAEITAKGYVCLLTPEKVKYDLVADVDDNLIKIQIKTVLFPRKASKTGKLVYEFSLKKNRNKDSIYEDGDIDGFALVAFNQRQIAFSHQIDTLSINFRVHGVSYSQQSNAKYMDDPIYSFETFADYVIKNKEKNKEKKNVVAV